MYTDVLHSRPREKSNRGAIGTFINLGLSCFFPRVFLAVELIPTDEFISEGMSQATHSRLKFSGKYFCARRENCTSNAALHLKMLFLPHHYLFEHIDSIFNGISF